MRELAYYLIVFYVLHVDASNTELTVEVSAGKAECFFTPLKKGEIVDIEYQVIDGGKGEYDITFQFTSPSGILLLHDAKHSDNDHRVTMTEDGDFKSCWDNSFSSFNSKLVFFAINVDRGDSWDAESLEFPSSDAEVYDVAINEIQAVVGRVRGHLIRSRHDQDQLRLFEARDRSQAERVNDLVTNWSTLQVLLMLIVGALQVVMVRSLFDSQSAFSKVWQSRILR